MKMLCITGLQHPYLKYIEDVLQNAGMTPAVVKYNNKLLCLSEWYDLISSNLDVLRGDDVVDPSVLERSWSQAVEELCAANVDALVWGWVEPKRLWTLDLWQKYEPNFYAILPCLTPQRWLAWRMLDHGTALEAGEALSEWFEAHQHLLRIHFRHPDRTLLVDGNVCLAHPQMLVKYCKEHWQIPLDYEGLETIDLPPVDPLAHYLAQQVCYADAEVWSLQQNVEASLENLCPDTSSGTLIDPNLLEAAVQSYQQMTSAISRLENTDTHLSEVRQEIESLLTRLNEYEQLHENALLNEYELKSGLDTLNQAHQNQLQINAELERRIMVLDEERETQLKVIDQYKDQNKTILTELDSKRKLEAELQVELESLRCVGAELNELSDKNKSLNIDLLNSQDENAVLLQQLHLVQEELESVFIKSQESETKLAELLPERDAQSKAKVEAQTRIGALEQERADLVAARDAEGRAKAEALAQRDAEAKAKAEAQARTVALEQAQKELTAARDALAQEQAALSQARDAEAKAKAEALAQRDAQAQMVGDLRDQINTLSTERDNIIRQRDEYQIRLEALSNTESESKMQNEKAKKLEAELKDAQDENDLLLQQLHIVQEELENIFLKGQDSGQLVMELTAERDRLANISTERQGMIESLTKSRDDLNKLAKDRRAQIDARDKLIAELRERIKVLGAECNAQTKIANQREKTIEKLQGLEARLKELQLENKTLYKQLESLKEKPLRIGSAAPEADGGVSDNEQGASANEGLIAELKNRIEDLNKLAKSRRVQIDQRDEEIRRLRENIDLIKQGLKAQTQPAAKLEDEPNRPVQKMVSQETETQEGVIK
jgi:chromosome segregation ATPase